MKLTLLSVSLLLLSACSNNVATVNKDSLSSQEQVNIVQLKKSGVISKDAKEVFIADIGNKEGASFSVNIDSSSGFNTKASTDGTVAKTSADIKSLNVYLIKHSDLDATYPNNGDPLNEVVAGPFALNRTGAGPYTVTFTNVGASPAGTKYYVAVRAYDAIGGIGNELIKANNGRTGAGNLWTGTTAATNKISVSTTGVAVGSDLKVTPTTALPIAINLLDAAGASIEASVTPTSGDNNLPAVTAN